jgi:antitoxin CptB
MEEPRNDGVVRETLVRSSGPGSRVPVSFAISRAHQKERAMTDLDAAAQDAALSAARLHWRSRRGLRELDLLFLPFVEEAYATLPPAEQLAYQRLLAEEDTELLLWMTGRAAPLDPELSGIVAKIRAHAGALDG